MNKFDETNSALLAYALSKLEQSKEENYYNDFQDGQNRDQYYKDIVFESNGEELFQQLSQLTRKTHKNQLPYQPAQHLYPDVDLQPDNSIHSIYSKEIFSPETLIVEDLRTDQMRGEQMRKKIVEAENFGGQSLTNFFDALEDQLPYNCEHVVPQSWFDKHQPMKGDLHHLFACEKKCNQFRGNIPYFDFNGVEGTVKTDCGQTNGEGFEPLGGKGRVARAVLYFLLRYPGEINRVKNEYTEAGIEIILTWHDNAKPEVYEKHRNAVIFSKQGNRNPLIDFPELAKKINFSLGLG